MTKLKIKTGDNVVVTAGDNKGSEGKVLRVFAEKNKAIVEGVNMVKKHEKPSSANPQGGITEKEAPIHISNLSLIDSAGKATRVGYDVDKKTGVKFRFAKSNKEKI